MSLLLFFGVWFRGGLRSVVGVVMVVVEGLAGGEAMPVISSPLSLELPQPMLWSVLCRGAEPQLRIGNGGFLTLVKACKLRLAVVDRRRAIADVVFRDVIPWLRTKLCGGASVFRRMIHSLRPGEIVVI